PWARDAGRVRPVVRAVLWAAGAASAGGAASVAAVPRLPGGRHGRRGRAPAVPRHVPAAPDGWAAARRRSVAPTAAEGARHGRGATESPGAPVSEASRARRACG